jgi:predicted RNase H-like HicB family nuclease
MVNYRVIIEKDEDGILVGRVPDLPGCATEGKTRVELMKNLKEAIEKKRVKWEEYRIPEEITKYNQDKE